MRSTKKDELTSTIDGTDGLPTKILPVANPQMAMNYERSTSTCPMPKLPTLFSMEPGRPSQKDKLAGHVAASSSWSLLSGEPHFNLGVLVLSQSTSDIHLAAIAKPASSCAVTALVILQQQASRGDDNDENPAKENGSSSSIIREWLNINEIERHDEASIALGWGEDGFQTLLKKPDIHAMYIIVPPGHEREYVLAALKAGKHVLLKDPLSTSLHEFTEQLEFAKRYQKFIQFSTMFVHQYRVGRFMDRVIREQRFGRIHTINANLQLSYDDLDKVGKKFPLEGPGDGCIRVLGRFCVLVSALIFSRIGSTVTSAQVLSTELGSLGECVAAKCVVHFTENRALNFKVGYTNNFTRQSIEVKADCCDATMTDFVTDHPDGLASYRIYEKAELSNGKEGIVSGESIDVAGGFSQDVTMWRTFVQLSDSMDKGSWAEDCSETSRCRELANVALQTKKTLIALLKSAEASFQLVDL